MKTHLSTRTTPSSLPHHRHGSPCRHWPRTDRRILPRLVHHQQRRRIIDRRRIPLNSSIGQSMAGSLSGGTYRSTWATGRDRCAEPVSPTLDLD